jgi:anti-sigma factor RsiW
MAEVHPNPHPDLAGYLLGGLDAAEERAFAEHLAGCETCRAELEELADLPGLLADVPAAEPLPPGLEERTFAAVEVAAADDGPDGTAAEVVPITPAHAKKARRRPSVRWLAAVAAAVIVLGAGIGVLTSLTESSPRPLATVRLISATGGQAHALAVIRSTPAGLTIDMTAEQLPPTSPSHFYTCWLVGNGDTLSHPNRVSVGSFVVRGRAPVHVHWTTAADLRRFPHLGVTLEPNNGIPSHQGPKVLVGV